MCMNDCALLGYIHVHVRVLVCLSRRWVKASMRCAPMFYSSLLYVSMCVHLCVCHGEREGDVGKYAFFPTGERGVGEYVCVFYYFTLYEKFTETGHYMVTWKPNVKTFQIIAKNIPSNIKTPIPMNVIHMSNLKKEMFTF